MQHALYMVLFFFSEIFRRLSVHPWLIKPVKQLLQDDIYIYQSRLNPKKSFEGGSWNWHQDFGTWHAADLMASPRCVVTGVFLDPITPVNAPLLVVPCSHTLDVLLEDVTENTSVRTYRIFEITESKLNEIVQKWGIHALTAPAGSVAFLHPNLVHGSSNNISPYRRAIQYFIYNSVQNKCEGLRPWFLCNRDFTPLQAGKKEILKEELL